MGKYLRIANRNPGRGFFPRQLLRILGASTKRERLNDHAIGGWFGSGTKYAPIAAANLGIEVRISSWDELGRYSIGYSIVVDDSFDEPLHLLALDFGAGPIDVMDYSTQGAMNWTRPIGDDPYREFRILREYVRNAKDADPSAPYLVWTNQLNPASEGVTFVYLSRHPSIEAMLARPERYFKYLVRAGLHARRHFSVDGLGSIHPKSEPGITRLFTQGTLAMCSKAVPDQTSFDYSFDRKELVSEDRTFQDMSGLKRDLAKLLASVNQPLLASVLLTEMRFGRAEFEAQALAYLSEKDPIPGAAAWRAAWALSCGEKAVIATSGYANEYARYSAGATPIPIRSYSLVRFLRLCGVMTSDDHLPDYDKNGYRLVRPTPEQARNLALALTVLKKEGHLAVGYPHYIFVPSAGPKAVKDNGFTVFQKPVKGIYIRQDCLNAYQDAYLTLCHEHRHGRTNASDDSRVFIGQADDDQTRFMVQRYGDPPALEIDPEFIGWVRQGDPNDTIVISTPDLFPEAEFDPDPLPEPPEGMSEETKKTLDLISRAIDEAVLETPDDD